MRVGGILVISAATAAEAALQFLAVLCETLLPSARTQGDRNENPPRISVDARRVALATNQPAATLAVTLPVARSIVNALPFTTRSANCVPLKVTTELRVVTVVPFVASVRVTL